MSSNFGDRQQSGQKDYQHRRADYYLASSPSLWPAPGYASISSSSSSGSCELQFLELQHQLPPGQLGPTDAVGLRRMRAPNATSYRPAQQQGNHLRSDTNHLHLAQSAKVLDDTVTSAATLAVCPPVPAPPATGGQRMALKLASGGGPRQAWQMGGRAASYAGCGSDGSIGGAHCHAQLTDDCSESECSCSNSLECLAQQQQARLHQLPQHHSHRQLQLHSSGSLDRSRQNPNQLQQRMALQQHFHPALMAHRSVPTTAPTSQPAAQMSCPSSVSVAPVPGSPPPPPPPPPLIRQSTYTATSSTITDSQPVPLTPSATLAAGPGGPVASDYVPASQHVPHYSTAPHKAPKQRGQQSVSFRRAGPMAASSEQHQVVAYGGRSKSQRHSESTPPPQQPPPAQQQRQHSNNTNNNSTDNSRSSLLDLTATLDQRRLRGSNGAKKRVQGALEQMQYGGRPNLNLTACPSPAGQQPVRLGLNQPRPPGSAPLGGYPGAAGHANGAYRLGPAQFGHFDASLAGCSVPAISSHRTNSPWMRVSSIILTPIGIVIILFIVVSPLLHYLM